jgi:hypothetical protein
MRQQHWGTYCQACRRPTMHVLHLLITIFLCGLWWPVWLIFAVNTYVGPWVCSQCGAVGGTSAGENPFGALPAVEPPPPPVVTPTERPKYRLGPKVVN